jgi:hypothetical protein
MRKRRAKAKAGPQLYGPEHDAWRETVARGLERAAIKRGRYVSRSAA